MLYKVLYPEGHSIIADVLIKKGNVLQYSG